MMRKYIYPLLAILLAPTLTACLNDDSDTEYDDYCYITSFSLGSLKRTLYTTSSTDQDSAYTTTFAGSLFPMTINHKTLTIENMDSLPLRTITSKVLTTATYVGSLAWRKADLTNVEDTTWTAYSTSDSLDFSTPLHFASIASNGNSYRTYTVKVNVHQQNGDSTVWNAMPTADLLNGKGERKALVWNDMLVVLAENTDGTLTYAQLPTEGGTEWVSVATTGTEGAQTSTLSTMNDKLYMSTSEGKILQSSNAVNWTEAAFPAQDGLVLVGASDNKLYALANGKLVSSNGEAWSEEILDDDETNLPTANLHTIHYTRTGSKQTLMLLGEKSTEETSMTIWTKSWSDNEDTSWMYYTPNNADKKRCPVMNNLNVTEYDGGLLAFGGASRDGRYAAMDSVLYSKDYGITWKPYDNDDMLVDEAIQAEAQQASHITSAVDKNQFLWILVDNKVWRGRINRIGFLRQDPD